MQEVRDFFEGARLLLQGVHVFFEEERVLLQEVMLDQKGLIFAALARFFFSSFEEAAPPRAAVVHR